MEEERGGEFEKLDWVGGEELLSGPWRKEGDEIEKLGWGVGAEVLRVVNRFSKVVFLSRLFEVIPKSCPWSRDRERITGNTRFKSSFTAGRARNVTSWA